MNEPEEVPYLVQLEESGERLDVFLARHLPDSSRSQIAKSLADKGAMVSGRSRKSSYRLQAGELVLFAPPTPRPDGPQPELVDLDVIFEDDHMVAINKPIGMVVHPAKGHWHGTLASALAGRYGPMSDIGGENRPGIVHRLDRDTSGVIVVARTNRAHMELARQFEAREVKKEYFAITRGEPSCDRDWIDQPIGPHPRYRERMAVRPDHPLCREARTFYEVLDRYHGFCALRIEPHTGRTHQIRVHLAHLGTPVLCDPLYGDARPITQADVLRDRQDDTSPLVLSRLALHAAKLRLQHPIMGSEMEFKAPLPDSLVSFLAVLEQRNVARSR